MWNFFANKRRFCYYFIESLNKIKDAERDLKVKEIYRLIFFLLSFSLLICCGGNNVRDESSSGGGERQGGSIYQGEDEHLIIVVDVELARRRMEQKYFPLSIKIANKRLPGLTLTRNSFILIDENRIPYYMPGVVELKKNYNMLASDSRFRSQTGLLGDQLVSSFSYYRKAESHFFPQTAGAGRVFDEVYVRQRGYMEDLIYFPMPPGGIEGKVLILRIDAEELEVPADIAFTVS
jgi:hypothetical protein